MLDQPYVPKCSMHTHYKITHGKHIGSALKSVPLTFDQSDMIFPPSSSDIDRLQLMAKQYNMIVIPLVQTFGHFEVTQTFYQSM